MGAVDLVQIDARLVLIHDTVLNNGHGSLDMSQDSMDGSGFMFVTQSAAIELGGVDTDGLPDDAFFSANADHPDVTLHFRNTDDGPNSRIIDPGDSVTFVVPARAYSNVQIYGVSTQGSSIVDFILGFDDRSTDFHEITFQDWALDSPAAGQLFLADHLGRYKTGFWDAPDSYAISGVNIDTATQKTLVTMTITRSSLDSGHFVFFGAVGW